jgi:hypothetical protein
MAILNRRTRRGAFEITSENGLIGLYAVRKAMGEGGKPDPKLEALLAERAQRLQEKQEKAKLVKQRQRSSLLGKARYRLRGGTQVPACYDR